MSSDGHHVEARLLRSERQYRLDRSIGTQWQSVGLKPTISKEQI